MKKPKPPPTRPTYTAERATRCCRCGGVIPRLSTFVRHNRRGGPYHERCLPPPRPFQPEMRKKPPNRPRPLQATRALTCGFCFLPIRNGDWCVDLGKQQAFHPWCAEKGEKFTR